MAVTALLLMYQCAEMARIARGRGRLRPNALHDSVKRLRVAIDAGVYAHQVQVAPSNRTVILATRGNDAAPDRPEAPGAIKVFDFAGGQLTNERSIAPGNGFGFGPRHVDFHPGRPWMYASIERGNQLQVFGLHDGVLDQTPLFAQSTLSCPGNARPGQVAGGIHVARDGRTVYLANRADGTTEWKGRKVFAGGENSIAVFRIDARNGEPTLVQQVDTRGVHARTFALHPGGRMLVAASVLPMLVRKGETLRQVSAGLSVPDRGRRPARLRAQA